ncbi:MAG TPA: putative DNA-binding domain-containing protein [Holophagaceae bacterium]|nr:putative DNA-binding domain-containing protein [Holophagaceae bacterium]
MSRLQDLQRSLFDLVLAPDPGPFLADPVAWGKARGLGAPDRSALAARAPRLAVYRELVQFALTDPVADCYPITRSLLASEGVWETCLGAFLERRAIQSPYYRDVAPTFLAWLLDSGWGAERWPFLVPLAHWEHLELELLRHPDGPPPEGLAPEPSLPGTTTPDVTLRNLTYLWHVEEATEADPRPPEGPAHLLAWRDREGAFRSLELSATASALLTRWLAGDPLGPAAQAVGADPREALGLARDLYAKGALAGFSPA